MVNQNDDPPTPSCADGCPEQEQEQPGLTSATDPRLDHGEDMFLASPEASYSSGAPLPMTGDRGF